MYLVLLGQNWPVIPLGFSLRISWKVLKVWILCVIAMQSYVWNSKNYMKCSQRQLKVSDYHALDPIISILLRHVTMFLLLRSFGIKNYIRFTFPDVFCLIRALLQFFTVEHLFNYVPFIVKWHFIWEDEQFFERYFKSFFHLAVFSLS